MAVIEAGDSVLGDPLESSITGVVAAETNIDWQYESLSRTFPAGQSLVHHAGKALGGTRTMNGKLSTQFHG